MGRNAALPAQDEYDEDDYDECDERPNFEPTERPSDERGERPMRVPGGARWGPKRGRSR